MINAKIGHGRKYGRARAHHHARLSPLDAMPLLGRFLVGQRGMQDRGPFSENLVQIGGHRGSQADLRDEQDRGASRLEHRPHARQIHRVLPKPVDPVQQHARKLARRYAFPRSAAALAAAPG